VSIVHCLVCVTGIRPAAWFPAGVPLEALGISARLNGGDQIRYEHRVIRYGLPTDGTYAETGVQLTAGRDGYGSECY
jgi:hypothetical protein